ncbi:transcription factor Pcc1-domain-containing protein [Coniochaeta sp. 2T2.1]|nr:transcription factor Pcc1-domain-containing protein [Coniochaeta sp. 2T2.1]
MALPENEAGFPCALTVDVPFPTARLASVALQALGVDKELSPLVRRTLSMVTPAKSDAAQGNILRVEYVATTNRMLRVAVNGFMESLALVLEVMEKLDEDVLSSGKAQNGD